MNDPSNWQIFWNEFEKLLIYFLRPTVHMQLLTIILAAFAGWGLTKSIRRLTRHFYNPWVAGLSNKSAKRSANIVTMFIETVVYPAITLIILSLTIWFVEGQGWPTNLIRWSKLFFWALLGYRLVTVMLYSIFGKNQVRPYQRRLLAPVFWLLVNLWMLATFINLPALADVTLFTLFSNTSFTLGSLLGLALTLYFLFTFAWVAQEIILRVIEPRTHVRVVAEQR